MTKKESDLKTLGVPSRDNTFETLNVRTVKTTDRRYKPIKAPKPIQLNLKVPPALKSQFDAAFERANAKSPGLSKVKFLSAMLDEWTKGEAERDDIDIPDDPHSPTPTAQDLAHGRTELVQAFVTPAVAQYIEKRHVQFSWTRGVVFEDLLARVMSAARQK